MIIDEKEIRPSVVGNHDVRPAVIGQVSQYYAHPFCLRLADTRGITDVGKRAIMIVVIELDSLAAIVVGVAIGAVSGTVFTTPKVRFGRPLDVVANQQIEIPVLVVVEPSRAR